MNRRVSLLLSIAVALSPVALTGCLTETPLGPAASTGTPGGDPGTDQSTYQTLQDQLDAAKQKRLNNPAAFDTAAGRMFWVDANTKLHSFDPTTKTIVSYGFDLPADKNFRANASVIVTGSFELSTDGTTNEIHYRVFDATQANTQIDELVLLPAPSQTSYQPFAPDSDKLYILNSISGDVASNELLVWNIGVGEIAPTHVITLEDSGATLGDATNLRVSTGLAVAMGTSKAYLIDLTASKLTPKWVGNKSPVSDAFPDSTGVLLDSDAGPFFYNIAKNTIQDVSKLISSSGYQLAPSYPDAQLYKSGITRQGDNAVYIANDGVFTINLSTHDVQPVLLNPLDKSLTYEHPTMLADGTIFVQGDLATPAGSVSTELFQVDFKF